MLINLICLGRIPKPSLFSWFINGINPGLGEANLEKQGQAGWLYCSKIKLSHFLYHQVGILDAEAHQSLNRSIGAKSLWNCQLDIDG